MTQEVSTESLLAFRTSGLVQAISPSVFVFSFLLLTSVLEELSKQRGDFWVAVVSLQEGLQIQFERSLTALSSENQSSEVDWSLSSLD